MPAGACLNVLARSALTSTTVARRSASSGAGLASARAVTPMLSVLRAHPSSAAPSGVRCNAWHVTGTVVLGLALQGG